MLNQHKIYHELSMNNFYNWIIIIIFVGLLGYLCFFQKKYNDLKEEYIYVINHKEFLIDSLNLENDLKVKHINNLELKIIPLELKIDSLINEQNKIQKKDSFLISNTISESVNTLKLNLSCVDL